MTFSRFIACAVALLVGLAGAVRAQDEVEAVPADDAAVAVDAAMGGEPAIPAVEGDAIAVPEASIFSDPTPVGKPQRLSDYRLQGLTNRVNLTTMAPWDIVQLVEFLAYRGGLKNVVIGKGVAGLTTKLKFDSVTVADALEVVLSVNNLAYEIKGNILTVMTDDEYKTLYGTSFYDHKRVKLIELKYADPTRVASMLEKIKSTIGTIVADPVTGTIILIDTPEKILEMQAVIEKADLTTVSRVLPTETRTFALQYANVDDILPEVQALVTKEAGSVRVDKRTKTLMVTDLPHGLERVSQLIRTFDRSPRQVFIEAKIVETALGDDFSMGINWQHMFQNLDPRMSLESVSAPGGPSDPTLKLTFNTIVGGGNLEGVLEALRKVGETRILSNPHIAVMDGQEAMIEVVEDQPYKETQMEAGTTNITGVTYLFKKVGVQMAVTPRINDNRQISMTIKPEISSISQWYDGAPQEGTPVIRKALAETTIMVKDGVTIIIGGMIKDRKDTSVSKVPILGSIPLIGRLFRHDTDSTVNTETVVFLTPRIISGDEPYLLMRDAKKVPKPLRPVGRGAAKEMKPVR